MNHPPYVFIQDSYTFSRGEPAMLELYCAKCNAFLITYQKDGPGPLLRCYWDRIHGPENIKQLASPLNEGFVESLVCSCCQEVIGQKSIYEKEQRLAFALVEGSFRIDQTERP